MNKDMKKLVAKLEEQDFEIEVRGNGHVIVYKDNRKITTFSGTPSDVRSHKNSLSYLKRAGFNC